MVVLRYVLNGKGDLDRRVKRRHPERGEVGIRVEGQAIDTGGKRRAAGEQVAQSSIVIGAARGK